MSLYPFDDARFGSTYTFTQSSGPSVNSILPSIFGRISHVSLVGVAIGAVGYPRSDLPC